MSLSKHPPISHWSKDHAEHLRAVHFVLIAISAAVLIVIFSAKSYRPDRALSQISSILTLKSNWKSGVGLLEKATNITAVLDADGVDKCDFLKASGSTSKIYHINWKSSWRRYFGPYDEQFNLVSWEPEPPQNLAGIALWWEGLRQKPRFYAAVTIDRLVKLEFRTQMSRMTCVDPAPASLEVEVTPFFITRQNNSLTIVADMDEKSTGTFVGRLSFTLKQYLELIADQESVIAKPSNLSSTILLDVKPGPFTKSFSDLSRAADGLQFAKLDDVRAYLFSQVGKDEIIELLGLKIPLSQLTIWGVATLLGTQTLFIFYLRQLTGKLGSTDPAWEVLWIGMDQTPSATAMFFVTSVILPCLAVATLSIYSISQNIVSDFNDRYNPAGWTWNWSALALSKCLIMTVLTILSFRLGKGIWDFRPKLSDNEPTAVQP